jgi:glycosyltransferase involved in cell wall biosynthesis
MNTNKLISVIVPCYNNASYITETIDSILKQDYPSIETIIVNDGSTDNSEIVIKNLISQNTTRDIKYISQFNSGPSNARNTGAKLATGKYLLFLDGDDIIHPTYLSKCAKILENRSDINIVYSDSEFFDGKQGKWKLPQYDSTRMLYENCVHISAVIERSVFDSVGGFDENLHYAEDWELWLRIGAQKCGFYKIPEALFYYRKRKDKSSITDKANDGLLAELARLQIYTKHYGLYRRKGYDFITLINSLKYKKKYTNIWYRRLFRNLQAMTKFR